MGLNPDASRPGLACPYRRLGDTLPHFEDVPAGGRAFWDACSRTVRLPPGES
jgi:hypothetical protein